MRNSNRRVSQVQNVVCELPEGYEVRSAGFQRNELYFNGELLGVFEQRRWANNAAQRHLLENQVSA